MSSSRVFPSRRACGSVWSFPSVVIAAYFEAENVHLTFVYVLANDVSFLLYTVLEQGHFECKCGNYKHTRLPAERPPRPLHPSPRT
jgi:hypothetical protein